jgi:carbohydrate-binding DOMON domain-containing protein
MIFRDSLQQEDRYCRGVRLRAGQAWDVALQIAPYRAKRASAKQVKPRERR